jgi:hypothetical protein
MALLYLLAAAEGPPPAATPAGDGLKAV